MPIGYSLYTFYRYTTFGSPMPNRKINPGAYRYGFNGQEMDKELGEGITTAEFWEYDSRLGRRWNLDPKPIIGISDYSCYRNNPIWFNDVKGDSSVWDNKGYMIHYDPNDKDLRAFMKDGDKYSLLGTLGGEINADSWFPNLIKENSKEADDMWSPLTFKKAVQQYGKWDYKYASPANPNVDSKQHILGIAFYRKDKDKGIGDLSDTKFNFNGLQGRAEDLNNLHFGVVGDAIGIFGETFMLKQAGAVEMGKWKSEGKTVPKAWTPTTIIRRKNADGVWEQTTKLLPPYGDNPVDHQWIKNGFDYYNKNTKSLDGDWW